MISINIIPEIIKKEIKLKSVYSSIVYIFYILIILISFYAVAFLLSELFMQLNLAKTTLETSSVTKTTKNYNQKITLVNNELDSINEIKNEYIFWSYLLEYISNNVKSGLSINRISLDKTDNKILITGNSANRDGLLELKDFIENSEYFSDVDLPIQNLLEKNDVDFQISAKIKSYDFEKNK